MYVTGNEKMYSTLSFNSKKKHLKRKQNGLVQACLPSCLRLICQKMLLNLYSLKISRSIPVFSLHSYIIFFTIHK